MKVVEKLKEFWKFLQKDSWESFVVTLVLAFVLIKYLFFPLLSLLTGSALPLVIVESCSMHHYEDGFEKILESEIYNEMGIALEDTESWDFPNGFTKGDVIFVVRPKNLEVGDVLIFNAGARHPLIHRIIEVGEFYGTKGDNYKTNSRQLTTEKKISEDQLVGKALFRIPAIGWIKLIFFEGSRPEHERGFCE